MSTAIPKALRAGDWVVPVRPLDAMNGLEDGVALVPADVDVAEVLERIGAATAQVALVTLEPITGRCDGVAREVPLLTGGGVILHQAFIYSLGAAIVEPQLRVQQVKPQTSTVEVVLEVAERWVGSVAYALLREGGQRALRQRLASLLGMPPGAIVDVFLPQHLDGAAGQQMLRASVRLLSTAREAALRCSGREGLFVRPFFLRCGRARRIWDRLD